MTLLSTAVRATHLVTNAAWFGGSLMGAVALNPAARTAGDEGERVHISGEGWERWGPVQGAAVVLHLVSGVAILADNRNRVRSHGPSAAVTVVKTGLTAAALASSAAAYVWGSRLGRLADPAEGGTAPRSEEARRLRQALGRVQWATPVLTGAMLVADAALGEHQRGVAGLLDVPRWGPRGGPLT